MAANLLKEFDAHKLTGKNLLSLQPNYKKKLNMTALLNRGIMAAALLCLTSVTLAQTKIIVMTDTHVMAPELLINDGPAWQNNVDNDRKMIDYSRQLFDLMIERLKNDIRPDWVFITGDLTKDGELLSHNYVADKLEELLQAGIHTLIVPGNHDYGTGNAVYYDGERRRPAERANGQLMDSLYTHFGMSSADREPTTLTYACEPVAGLTVIGIDSGTRGELSATTLDWVCDKAQKAIHAGNRVIALMHHPIIPHITGIDKMTGPRTVAKDYETIRNRLTDAGVSAIFTGHFHIGDMAKDYNENLTDSIYDISTGSLISYPCEYREVTINKELTEMQISTHHITTLPDDPNFEKTSKNRLKKSIKRIVKGRTGKAKFPKNLATNKIANFVAKAAVVHAEGNEHKSSKAKRRNATFNRMAKVANLLMPNNKMLKRHGLTMNDIKTLVHSMLKNKTSYGIDGRENVTDDQQLTIRLKNL